MTKQIERRWNLRFYPLYSALAGEQDAVAPNSSRVIVSTNVAETSITIEFATL